MQSGHCKAYHYVTSKIFIGWPTFTDTKNLCLLLMVGQWLAIKLGELAQFVRPKLRRSSLQSA